METKDSKPNGCAMIFLAMPFIIIIFFIGKAIFSSPEAEKKPPRIERTKSFLLRVDGGDIIKCIRYAEGLSCDWNHPLKPKEQVKE